MTTRRALGIVLAASLVLGAWGLRWGLPSEYGWAPDELLPQDVDTAVSQRFAHGWHSKYPPLHFALLAVAAAPARLAGRVMGWDAAAVHDARMTSGRLLSLAMSLGVLILVHRCGRELGDPLAGVLAAALLAFSVPLRLLREDGQPRRAVSLLVRLVPALLPARPPAGADRRLRALRRWPRPAAVATKDQAFALYVLTVPVLVWEVYARRRSAG